MRGSPPTVTRKNNDLDNILAVDVIDRRRLSVVDRVRASLYIKSHFELYLWLQGEFQHCIPHQIFIAAWGDFSKELISFDIVSSIPAIRTNRIATKDISPFIGDLFTRWLVQGNTPFGSSFEALRFGPKTAGNRGLDAFKTMHSALVHGIRDARGRHDCLYVFLDANPDISSASLDNLRITLPFVDAALRQISHLPSQYATELAPHADPIDSPADPFLSCRELEIMEWVRMGKTNYEVGIILNISTFTVKNHLQRIFRKLNATNRAQAVSALRQFADDAMAPAAGFAMRDK